MWEGFWGSCRARGRAESRGHHPWGGGDGVVSEHGVLWEYRWGGVVGASGWKKFGKTDHAGWAEVELRG